jgi:sugar phosphate isomerase/epimerase
MTAIPQSPRLSCADSAFPRLSHGAALGVIADLGFEAVDVCVFEGYDHNPPGDVLADPARAADIVRSRLDQHGLRVADVFAIVGDSFEALAPNHPDEAVRAESSRQFEGFVEFARHLAAPSLTILPGAEFDGDDSLVRAAAELERRAQIAGEADLRLSVEPHYGSVVPTPARTVELLERTRDLGITLDLSHFAFQGIGQDESDPLLARTRHVHLRQAAPEVIQARAAEGTIDFPTLRDRLIAGGYDGYFALEYQWEEGWLDFTRVDCIAETADLRDVMLRRR